MAPITRRSFGTSASAALAESRSVAAGTLSPELGFERAAMERVLDHVVQNNTAQFADPAIVKELKTWIRFKGAAAVRTGGGLYSAASGNPNSPSWIGDLAFGWVYTPKGENDKYSRQIRTSAGITVFAGLGADQAHWVEVPALRPVFEQALGLAGKRPDLVVRFGRGALLPRSVRRPVQAVLV